MAEGPAGGPRPLVEGKVGVAVETTSSLSNLPSISFKDEVESNLVSYAEVIGVNGKRLMIEFNENPTVDEVYSVVEAVEGGAKAVGRTAVVRDTEVMIS